ncbi:Agamous-like MADS-box protein [Sesamum alatum]|uniref:Agamous-like MADS-box protein n=1 Tax=Sesamum alatum TaxID=300844 RepID=A0AAE1Y5Y8_9LAMI|nr:Agamous-like MADS-box protein [Sesamum alatum]
MTHTVGCCCCCAAVLLARRCRSPPLAGRRFLTEILQRYHRHIETESSPSTAVCDSLVECSKHSRSITCELLQIVERDLKEPSVDQLSVTDLLHLENELQTALRHTRTAKTHLLLDSISSLQEKEKMLVEEKEVLEGKIAGSKTSGRTKKIRLDLNLIPDAQTRRSLLGMGTRDRPLLHKYLSKAQGAWAPRAFFLPRPRYLRCRHSLLGSLVCSNLVILSPDLSGYGLVTFFVLLVRSSLVILPPDPRRHGLVVFSSYSSYARASSPYLLILPARQLLFLWPWPLVRL